MKFRFPNSECVKLNMIFDAAKHGNHFGRTHIIPESRIGEQGPQAQFVTLTYSRRREYLAVTERSFSYEMYTHGKKSISNPKNSSIILGNNMNF